jgi:hypothetical protein
MRSALVTLVLIVVFVVADVLHVGEFVFWLGCLFGGVTMVIFRRAQADTIRRSPVTIVNPETMAWIVERVNVVAGVGFAVAGAVMLAVRLA